MFRVFGMFALIGALFGCEGSVLSVEVLPPRTSASCSAPSAAAGSFARGVFDIQVYEEESSAYLADLRFTSRSNLVVDGLELYFSDETDGDLAGLPNPNGTLSLPISDAPLLGEDEDIRQAMVENVALLPRQVLETISTGAIGDNLNDETDRATVVVHMVPTSDNKGAGAEGVFTLDLCRGCLVEPPAEEECTEPDVVLSNSVCRKGQDVPSFKCGQASSGGLFGG